MKVKCDECRKEFDIDKFEEETIKEDIREIYFKCPHCNKKYNCFYTNRSIRRLQALQRKTKDNKEFERLKADVTNRMNTLKEKMKDDI